MMSEKIFGWLAGAVICSLLLAAGCAQTATLALKFTPKDSTIYKMAAQTERSVEFEGSLPDAPPLKEGRTGSRIEMTFTQRIQSVDGEGNAVAKITIEDLKYSSEVKNDSVLDFDSSRAKDKNNPLAKLIRQSYTIEIAPTGEVTKVIDANWARAVVKTASSANKTALRLLAPAAIKGRHAIMALPATGKNRLRTGESWSSIKTFSFGLMGSKSYERIYTLKEIKDTDSRQIAVVQMHAIPTSEMTEQLHKEQALSIFLEMFDNTETLYTGQLRMDLTAGKVEKYLEKLQSEWIAIDPEAKQEDDTEPATLRMSATRLYSIEKID